MAGPSRRESLALLGSGVAAVASGVALPVRGQSHRRKRSGSDPGGPAGSTDVAAGDRLVGAHYYPWYGPDNHWSNGYTGTPVLGEYDSRDPQVIDRHVDWASPHGIDWFNVSWWGQDSYSGRTLETALAPRLEGTPVRFSVLYEPKGLLEVENHSIDFDDRVNRRRLADHLQHLADTYAGNSNYLHVDGRPVLFLYIARTFTGDVAGAFETAEAEAGTDFYYIGDYGRTPSIPHLNLVDAVSPYNVYRPIEDTGDGFVDYVAHQYTGWRLLAEEFDFQFVPLVLPGFDNTEASWAPDGMPVLERTPERYRRLCDTARRFVDPDQPMALITSFNEWHEYTSVEPGTSSGTTYLELTRDHLARGAVGGATADLVPMTFHWRRTVKESSLNPDVPEGSGRDLALAVHDLVFVDGDESIVRHYDIGAAPEPIFTQGVSGAGSHEDLDWRWFTAGRRMQSRLYLPAGIAERARTVRLTARAAADGFTFDVSMDESRARTTVTMPGRRTTTVFDVPGAPEPTPTPSSTPTVPPNTGESSMSSPTAGTTDSTRVELTDRSPPTRETTPGFGLGAAAAALTGVALGLRRRGSRE